MGFLKKYKRIIAAVGLTILLSSLFFVLPRKAEAIVPVHDVGVLGQTVAAVGQLGSILGTLSNVLATAKNTFTSIFSLEIKDYILDPLLYQVAQRMLHQLSQNTIAWIKGGFKGNPLFIQDLETTLTDAADQASGRFMKEFLSPDVYNLLCSPFRSQLKIALKSYRRPYSERMQCTLSTVMANAQNAAEFGQKLREGDWGDWINVTTNPQNNPLGAVLFSINELESRQAAAVERTKTESIFNQGFLSMKKCAETYCQVAVSNEDGTETCEVEACARYETTSPGKWVQTQLSEATGIDFKKLALADEIDEIITAVVDELISMALSGGAGEQGIAYTTVPSFKGSCGQKLRDFTNTLSASIDEESDSQEILETLVSSATSTATTTAISTIQAAIDKYNEAKDCYQTKANSSEILTIDSKISDLERQRTELISEINGANGTIANISALEDIRARAQALSPNSDDCAKELAVLNKEYSKLKPNLHNISDAEAEQDAANQALLEAEQKLNECKGISGLPSILFQVRKPGGTWKYSINISSGGSAQIRWSSADAASCKIDPDGWTGLSGSQTLSNITNSVAYTITCEGAGGSTSNMVSIFVLP